jgi:hypothetical protein
LFLASPQPDLGGAGADKRASGHQAHEEAAKHVGGEVVKNGRRLRVHPDLLQTTNKERKKSNEKKDFKKVISN